MTARCHGSPRASSRRSRTAGAGRDGKEHQGRGGPWPPGSSCRRLWAPLFYGTKVGSFIRLSWGPRL